MSGVFQVIFSFGDLLGGLQRLVYSYIYGCDFFSERIRSKIRKRSARGEVWGKRVFQEFFRCFLFIFLVVSCDNIVGLLFFREVCEIFSIKGLFFGLFCLVCFYILDLQKESRCKSCGLEIQLGYGELFLVFVGRVEIFSKFKFQVLVKGQFCK